MSAGVPKQIIYSQMIPFQYRDKRRAAARSEIHVSDIPTTEPIGKLWNTMLYHHTRNVNI